jgi:hypothetical protein
MGLFGKFVRRALWKASLRALARRYRASRRIVVAKRRGDRWVPSRWIGKPPGYNLLRVPLCAEFGDSFLDYTRRPSPERLPIADFRPVVMAYKRPGFSTVVKWISWEVVE